MRGEHIVGGKRLTWVTGAGTDERSQAILAAGPAPRMARPPHGPNVRRAADGTLDYQPTNAPDGAASGTSVFDPVLCELAYRWWCPPAGLIVDPFAGGSVRGIVASKLGRRYLGVDLRPEQIAANETQAARICDDPRPRWIVGDSRALGTFVGGAEADFVFSCPPYGDLEVYSDDPADLSTLDYPAFLTAYRQIVAASVAALKADRFACFVVGDLRDRQGFYRGFVRDTELAFEDAGARFYNEAILVTCLGSLPIRVGRQFDGARKLGKTHQNVLVFCKGDPKAATAAVGAVEHGDIDGAAADPL